MTVVMIIDEAINNCEIIIPTDKDIPIEIKEYCDNNFWRGVKLLNNTIMWNRILPSSTLKTLAFQNLFNMKLIPYLRTLNKEEIVHHSEHIFSYIQKSKIITEEDGVLKEMFTFVELLRSLPSNIVPEKKDNTFLRRIVQLLIELNAKNEAEEIIKKNNIF